MAGVFCTRLSRCASSLGHPRGQVRGHSRVPSFSGPRNRVYESNESCRVHIVHHKIRMLDPFNSHVNLKTHTGWSGWSDLIHGLVKFLPAVPLLLCLALPGSFLNMFCIPSFSGPVYGLGRTRWTRRLDSWGQKKRVLANGLVLGLGDALVPPTSIFSCGT